VGYASCYVVYLIQIELTRLGTSDKAIRNNVKKQEDGEDEKKTRRTSAYGGLAKS